MKSILSFTIIVVGLTICERTYAQVTIGSGEPPAKGALLDMKQKEAVDGKTSATKGVIFPRVELSGLTSLQPLLNATDAGDVTQQLIHKGTVVYNVTVSADLQEGFYYWDGTKWASMGSGGSSAAGWELQGNNGTEPANNFVGTTDNKDLSIRTNSLDRMHITSGGNVGIGTVTPQYMLDVAETARVNNLIVSVAPLLANATNMVIDDSGNVGRAYKAASNFTFGDIYSVVMGAPVTNKDPHNSIIKIPLNVQIEVTTPPHTECLYFIDYNMPCHYIQSSSQNIQIGYIGVTLFKTTIQNTAELPEGSRKFTTFVKQHANTSAVGMPIIGKAIDRLRNESDIPQKTTYSLSGYIEMNVNGDEVRFGMYAATGENYNWGRGTMSVLSYIKVLD